MARGGETVCFRIRRATFALCVCVAATVMPCRAQERNAKKAAAPPSEEFSQILSWLPADTETIVVANGPFSLPDLSPRDEELPPIVESVDDLKEDFEALPLALLGFKSDLLANRLQGQKVTFAIEGARHFRNSEGLGTAPFEGCSIAVFERDVSERTSLFLKESANAALAVETIEEQTVAEFHEQLESDMWTFFVTFPKPNMALACTSRDYLREVLVRMRGARGAMALPDQLPEWKYIDTHARFWGFRHFDKTQPKEDPSSPFPDEKSAGMSANVPDNEAIGLTFRFDPNKSRTATITYFSADQSVLRKLKSSQLSGSDEPSAKDLNVEFREQAPGVVAIAYDLGSPASVNFFLLLLGTSLGHAVLI
jgi:hypothetical protein